MGKYYSITREQVISMIEEVNEKITAVTSCSIMAATEAVMSSIHEDAVWTESQIDVTFSSIKAVVTEWVAEHDDDDDYDNDDGIIHQYFGSICQCEECTRD